MTTPDQLATELRFHLEQLSAKNGHHEFEHLCRYLARERICRNILPATGPVTAGGDQGRDFETFRTFIASQAPKTRGFLGRAEGATIAFICTLEKGLVPKIKSDLKKIFEGGFKPTHVYAFATADLPVAKRNKVIQHAKETHGVELTVLDGQAISELLIDRDVFWIAARYLSVPSELLPPIEQKSEEDDWYSEKKRQWQQTPPEKLNFSAFYEAKQGLRFATHNESLKADILFWSKRIEQFLAPMVPEELRQRARYEILMAAIRGLRAANDRSELLADYFREANEFDDPRQLEDAVVLLAYCRMAQAEYVIDVQRAQLDQWHHELVQHIDGLLSGHLSNGERCSLLQSRGYACLRFDLHPPTNHGLSEALSWWRKLLNHIPKAPLFPLEQFSEVLASFAPYIQDFETYNALTQEIDTLLAQRSGKFAAAEQCQQRAKALALAGKLRFALRELHRAKIHWFASETLVSSLRAMLSISDYYYELRLPAAAKYYALAAAFGAAVSNDEHARGLLPTSLLQAADCDHAQGAWLGMLSLLPSLVATHVHLRPEPMDISRHPELQYIFAKAGEVVVAATTLCPSAQPLINKLIDTATLQGPIGDLENELHREWKGKTPQEIIQQLQADTGLQITPLLDAGAHRQMRWTALGITWLVTFDNTRDATAVAEEFCAVLQILLVELAEAELYLLKETVHLDVHVEPVQKPELIREPSKPSHWKLQLPFWNPSRTAVGDMHTESFVIASQILADLALLPVEDFAAHLEHAYKNGLGSNVFVARPYAELFLSAVTASNFVEEERAKLAPSHEHCAIEPSPHPELAWRDMPILKERGESRQEVIQGRYETILHAIPRTLKRLASSPEFQEVVQELRKKGWLDWHILGAVFSLTINYRFQSTELSRLAPQQTQEWISKTIYTREADDAPDPPLFEYSLEQLEDIRRFNLPATLVRMGLVPRDSAQNLEAIEHFLAVRTGYWTEDCPHEDPFRIEAEVLPQKAP